jgi:predicted small metal-binding protein
MAKVIHCPCGYAIHEQDDEALVRAAQDHAKSVHGIDLTKEQALAMAKPEQEFRRD